jgi:hypothetical protein
MVGRGKGIMTLLPFAEKEKDLPFNREPEIESFTHP